MIRVYNHVVGKTFLILPVDVSYKNIHVGHQALEFSDKGNSLSIPFFQSCTHDLTLTGTKEGDIWNMSEIVCLDDIVIPADNAVVLFDDEFLKHSNVIQSTTFRCEILKLK